MSDSSLLFIHALTGLHPGSGTALGVVDLPVQRERHTDWPTIPGSSIKGIIRDAARPAKEEDDQRWNAAFGPERITNPESTFAGAVAFTDARILAFPVRSASGVFAWATSPSVLQRLQRDLRLADDGSLGGAVPALTSGQAAVPEKSPLVIGTGSDAGIVLEEFDFALTEDGTVATRIAGWFADRAVADSATKERIRSHLAILSDDDFTYFVRYATEVTARIRLDYETKTVAEGALFYQEFLPAETILYSVVLASAGRNRNAGSHFDARQMLEYIGDVLSARGVLQIGGEATTGKGICAVSMAAGEGGTI